jgi:oligoribonuclease (3'-5' exoribonuclease)
VRHALMHACAQIDTLKELGVDGTLQNSYGESCDAKYEKLAESKNNMIFLDLELTSGFYDVGEHARILEVAVIITDKDLKELGRGSWVIGGFSAADLNALKDFHQRTFRDAEPGGLFPPLPDLPGNGLFSDILASTKTKDQVSQEILKLLQTHCVERSCPIVGNSIQCDREVLMLEMPEVYHFFNHRIIDVSTFTGVMERWLPRSLEAFTADQKENAHYNHRAINDAESSIQAMRWIRGHMLNSSLEGTSTSSEPSTLPCAQDPAQQRKRRAESQF